MRNGMGTVEDPGLQNRDAAHRTLSPQARLELRLNAAGTGVQRGGDHVQNAGRAAAHDAAAGQHRRLLPGKCDPLAGAADRREESLSAEHRRDRYDHPHAARRLERTLSYTRSISSACTAVLTGCGRHLDHSSTIAGSAIRRIAIERSASASPDGNSSPQMFAPNISASAKSFVATTGTPHRIASRAAMPNDSIPIDGTSRTSIEAYT